MLLAMSGLKGSGKDTVANIIVKEYGFTKIAFADALRQMCLIIDPVVTMQDGTVITTLSSVVKGMGWDQAKRKIPEVRRLMQVIGTEAVRGLFGENTWITALHNRYPDMADESARYIITDCRFDNEADFVHCLKGDIIWVDRPGLLSDGHASESPALKERAQYILDNNETIEELEEDVRFLMCLRGIDPIGKDTT
jgi:hypothetical protein